MPSFKTKMPEYLSYDLLTVIYFSRFCHPVLYLESYAILKAHPKLGSLPVVDSRADAEPYKRDK